MTTVQKLANLILKYREDQEQYATILGKCNDTQYTYFIQMYISIEVKIEKAFALLKKKIKENK